MHLNEYQQRASTTAIYPGQGAMLGVLYCALGAAGEAGELANIVKKIIRDNDSVLTLEATDAIIKEVGDCLWYLAMIAKEINISLDYIADTNLKKLTLRKERNTLHGSGDNR